MEKIIVYGFVLAYIIFSVFELRNLKITAKKIATIGIFAGMSALLWNVSIPLPNGGGISPLGMLPLMLIGSLLGREVGLVTGAISGVLAFFMPSFVALVPIQVLLDYILPRMILGYAGIFGTNKKYKLILGSVLVMSIKICFHILSGVIFFGEFTPEGMNPWVYSIIYNAGSGFVEMVLIAIAIYFIPVDRLKKVI